jgi:hypothetical protein
LYVGASLHETVAFVGFADPSSPTGINVQGTGFFIYYQGAGYFVTARHVAEQFDSDPFVMRVNRRGKAELLHSDQTKWVYHPDPTVDLAAVALALPKGQGFDSIYLTEDILMRSSSFWDEGIGIGSPCYTIGLFHCVYGQERNIPIVHTGNIALMAAEGEHIIPVHNKKTKKPDMVEGYLIESAAINGASGSPVFARPTVTAGPYRSDQGKEFRASWPEAMLLLLGLFQGAWFAPPDAPLARNVNARSGDIVPVGVGVIVPAYKIIELLEVEEMRDERAKNPPVPAAIQTTVSGKASPPSNDANPTHQEDFTRLLGAAARKPEPKD